MNQRVGIFGGTFDPIHFGHLITIQYVKEILQLNKIIFVPCFISPLKQEFDYSETQHRLNMLKLAIENIEYFDFSDYELNRKEISYTINTLQYLKNSYNNLELIIGYDNLLTFEKWHQPDKIIELAKLVVMKRKTDLLDVKNKFFDKAIILDTPTIEISSTIIRDRVRQNLPIDYFVPEKVKQYIFDNHLYI